MRKLVVFLAMLMFAIPVSAQVCSTGHFSFEVPDDWYFTTYENLFCYESPNGDTLTAFEQDMTEFENASADQIINLYSMYCDKDDFTITKLNGDLAAYYTTADRTPEISFVSPEASFMFYKNKYLLYIDYGSDYRSSKEDCLSALREVTSTVVYFEGEPSSYQMQAHSTEHFEYGVPEGWIHAEPDGYDIYYYGDETRIRGGVYTVDEYPLSSLVDGYRTMGVNRIYRLLANTIYENNSPMGEMCYEHLMVGGIPAYSFYFYLNFDVGYVYYTFLIDGEYLLVTEYSDSNGRFNEEFSASIVDALRKSIKPIE